MRLRRKFGMNGKLRPTVPANGRRQASPRPRGGRQTGALTIEDVARDCGVSAMTVSRVLNDQPRVSARTRERVLAAVARLGYSPNRAARALASAGARRLCLIYTNPSASYLSELLLGALRQTHADHAQLLVEPCDSGLDGATLHRLKADGVEGLLLPPPLCETPGLPELLIRHGLPGVAIAASRPPAGLGSVHIDDRHAAREMTHYLLSLGHRRIGFITGRADQSASGERLTGYREALAAGGAPFDRALVRRGQFTYRSGIRAAEQLLDLPKQPTAIFASNDDMAAATVAVAHRRHLDVPRDLTVVGFDDTALASVLSPALTTVRQPIAAMAEHAVRQLLFLIREQQQGTPPQRIEEVVAHQLIRRSSASRPPTS